MLKKLTNKYNNIINQLLEEYNEANKNELFCTDQQNNSNTLKTIRKSRVIFSINTNFTEEGLEELIENNLIEFFYIDSTCFSNVQVYFDIIKKIQKICEERKIYIGIMVSLRGRKVQLKMDKNLTEINLKKGDIVKIVSSTNSKTCTSESKLVVNLADFNKVIKVNDNIIIDDNKSMLKVTKIIKLNDHSQTRPNLLLNKCQQVQSGKITKYNKLNTYTEYNNTTSDDNNEDCNKYTGSPKEYSYNNTSTFAQRKTSFHNSKISEQALYLKTTMKKTDYKDITHELESENEKNFTLLEAKNNRQIQQIIKANDSSLKMNKPCLKMSSFSIADYGFPKIETFDEYESLCSVEYDCTLSENSCLFVPNVNFAKHGIDLLSQREVRELAELDNLGVEFVILPITNETDIESIKGILSEDSNIKIIASIPDYLSLHHINDILQYCYGVVLSRTFQLINKNNISNINELIGRLIKKCNNYGKPIFINMDFSGDFEEEPILKCKELMSNVIEGYDGYILEVSKFYFEKSIDVKFSKAIIGMNNNFLQQAEKLYDKKFTNPDAKLKHLKSISQLNEETEICLRIVLEFVKTVKQCVIVYNGDNLTDLKFLSFLRLKNPILIMSSKIDLLKTCRLYYGITFLEHVIVNFSKELLEKKIKDMFGEANIVLYQVKKGFPMVTLI